MARGNREQVVVAKRGCTCCGTGCVLMGLVVPGATFALWSTVGAVAAIATLTGVMLARGTQVALVRHRATSQERGIEG